VAFEHTTSTQRGSTGKRCFERSRAGQRPQSVQHLAIEINAAIEVVPFAQDLHVGLVHQPRRGRPLAILAHGRGQGRPELLDPARDRPAAHLNASVREHTGDTFGRGTQLEVVPNSEKMTSLGKR